MRLILLATVALSVGGLNPQAAVHSGKGAAQQSAPTAKQSTEPDHTQETLGDQLKYLEQKQALEAAEAEKKQDREIQRKLATYTKWLVIVGAVQFLALIVQAIVFLFTIRQTSDTAEKQLRAYIGVSRSQIKIGRSSIEGEIHAKNYGQTPAYNVRQWIHRWVEEFPLKVKLPVPSPDFAMTESIIGPSDHHIVRFSLPMQENVTVGTPQNTLYVHGEIR